MFLSSEHNITIIYKKYTNLTYLYTSKLDIYIKYITFIVFVIPVIYSQFVLTITQETHICFSSVEIYRYTVSWDSFNVTRTTNLRKYPLKS